MSVPTHHVFKMWRTVAAFKLIGTLIFAASLPIFDTIVVQAGTMKSEFDSLNQVEFFNELKTPPEPIVRPGLCIGAKSVPGQMQHNGKTLREFMGKQLKSISIERVAPAETALLFHLGQQAISDALQKSPKTLYGYQPWANQVNPEFVGHLHYANGKIGALEVAYGYIAFQDASGKYWWSRFASPEDLNLTNIEGILRSQSGSYVIHRADGKDIWLEIVENKIQAKQLTDLTGKVVRASGELRTVPVNETRNIPKGADYLKYGYTIEAHK